ncbi:A disintegrin and metallopeptidase domain 3-like [Elephas maximus indicus]|uniref:A disintegrin and metallopeptidase domain 3-like n=1 Tax=Elephas maximus indicus TaxID=99487 RepID=UPI0021169DC4|nr:A disintegrin and metallopeptidase domain 3-like [Elephas maximus indicus]
MSRAQWSRAVVSLPPRATGLWRGSAPNGPPRACGEVPPPTATCQGQASRPCNAVSAAAPLRPRPAGLCRPEPAWEEPQAPLWGGRGGAPQSPPARVRDPEPPGMLLGFVVGGLREQGQLSWHLWTLHEKEVSPGEVGEGGSRDGVRRPTASAPSLAQCKPQSVSGQRIHESILILLFYGIRAPALQPSPMWHCQLGYRGYCRHHHHLSGFQCARFPILWSETIPSFLDPHFLVYSYNKSGALQSRSSFLKDHCFYRGYAAEVLNSVATLNTCSGLRGLLQLENVSYGIEPLQSAGTYEHMLYQIRNKKIDFFPSQGNYLMKPPEDQVNRILVKSEKNPDAILLKRNLKVQIILDKALYDYMGSDVAIAEEKVVQMFGLINTMFSQLKVTVRLSSLELWSDKNKISTNGDPNDILQRFLAWKEAYLVQRPHDMAYLLIYRDYPNYVGATYHGVACNPKLAAGIALYPKLITLEAFSVVMTQLLGINLGLTYDAIYKCYCPGNTCIMNPDSIHSHGVKFFSSCSLDEFKHVVTQPEFECLQNQIISKVAFQGRQSHSTCGNGRLEPPEECDCGSAEACEYKKCCNPLDCTLLESAECGTGPCCNPKTCQVTEHGEVCRESVDPCDLIEYCNGTSELCGPDMNTLNFEQCLNETAFCYNGLCRSMDRQCFEVFGKFARGADYLCLQEVNSHADDFGRCIGRTCTYEGILCGKIVCHWTTTDLVTMADYDVQYTYVAGRVCVSAAVTEAAFWSIFDNTFVEMGTICGSDKNSPLHIDLFTLKEIVSEALVLNFSGIFPLLNMTQRSITYFFSNNV